MEYSIIKHDIEKRYRMSISNTTPVKGGWLNKKWCADIENGKILIKQFSYQRYSYDKMYRIAAIEEALKRHITVHNNGVKCPRIYTANDKIIQILPDNIWYMVMDFSDGHMESPDTITEIQMNSLGEECGKMHHFFSNIQTENEMFDYDDCPNQLMLELQSRRADAQSSKNEAFINAVSKHQAIIESIDDHFFDNIPKGITHSDFTFDNILFDDSRVTAILDFDRCRYAYMWQDIGRAILSFAYNDGKISRGLVLAFISGYQKYLPLTIFDIIKAIKLAWCIEVGWWIHESVFNGQENVKVLRFAEEINWVTDNWFELQKILES